MMFGSLLLATTAPAPIPVMTLIDVHVGGGSYGFYYSTASATDIYIAEMYTNTGYIVKINKATKAHTYIRVLSLTTQCNGIVWVDSHLWVCNQHSISKLSAAGDVIDTYPFAYMGYPLFDGANVFVRTNDSFSKLGLDGSVISSVSTPDWGSNSPQSACLASGNVWYINNGASGRTITVLSCSDLSTIRTLNIANAKTITFDGSSVWVSCGNTTIYKINPTSGDSVSYTMTADVNCIKWLSSVHKLAITCLDDTIKFIDSTGVVLASFATELTPGEPVSVANEIYIPCASRYVPLLTL